MQIEVFPEISMIGLTGLRYFSFMRRFLKLLRFGKQILKQKFSLKKLLKSSREMTKALFLPRYVEIVVNTHLF